MHISITPLMLVTAALMGSISAFLAYKRERNPYIWFTLGFLFGMFGFFALFYIGPKKKKQPIHLARAHPIISIHGPTNKFWYYLDASHQQKGPMSHDALTTALKEGKVGPSTYVWHEEMSDWKQLKETLRREQPQI